MQGSGGGYEGKPLNSQRRKRVKSSKISLWSEDWRVECHSQGGGRNRERVVTMQRGRL